VRNELVQTTDLIQCQYAITQVQLEALGRAHERAILEVARSLATADLLRAGRESAMSAPEQAAYQGLDAEFLKQVGDVMSLFGEKVIRAGIPSRPLG
jgi:hypothetical protein